MHRLISAALLLLALASAGALRAGERRIAFRVTPFDRDQVRVEAVGAVDEDVRWVVTVEPNRRWDAARGRVAFVEVVRGAVMRVVGTVSRGGRVLGRIGGRFTYGGTVYMLSPGGETEDSR